MKKVSILPRTRTWAVADHTWALGQRTNNIFITCSFWDCDGCPACIGISKVSCHRHGPMEGVAGSSRSSSRSSVRGLHWHRCAHMPLYLLSSSSVPFALLFSSLPCTFFPSFPLHWSLVTCYVSFPSPGRTWDYKTNHPRGLSDSPD